MQSFFGEVKVYLLEIENVLQVYIVKAYLVLKEMLNFVVFLSVEDF